MKILFVTGMFPYPPIGGTPIKTYNLVRELSKKHEVFLLSLYTDPADTKDRNISQMEKYCTVVSVLSRERKRHWIVRAFTDLFGKQPYFVASAKSSRLEAALTEFIKTERMDLAHFEILPMGQYGRILHKILPTVISPNDSTSLFLIDEARYLPNRHLIKKIYRYLVWRRMRSYEGQICAKFDKCHLVSDRDRAYLMQLNSSIDAEVIPNGVDTDYFTPLRLPSDYPSLIYAGDMGGGPAIYATWFIRHVLPKVRKAVPSVKVYLAGKNPHKKLLRMASQDKNIIVTGFVEDIRPYIDRATLSISPVMKTCGILNKVLEAMAMGKAVVGLKASFSGIEGSIRGENMVAVEDEKEFADWIIRLIKDEELREKIGKNARLFVKSSYTWEETGRKAEISYRRAIEKFHGRVEGKNGLTQRRS